MPFGKKYRREPDSQAKWLETDSPSSVKDRAVFSLQSFGLSLLQQECTQAPKQNVFISPLSIFLVLTMTENGAAGETKAAMRKVLCLPADASENAVNESAAALLKLLRSEGDAELSIANAVWADVRSTIAPDFVRICEEIFDSRAQTLDLSQRSSATTINDWIAEKTNGRIPSIVTPDAITGAITVLTNAIYFKGKFCCPFRKEATRPETFNLANGSKKLVPMMRASGRDGSYLKGHGFQGAVLRYKGTGLTLYMVLPASGIDPEQLLTQELVQDMILPDEKYELDLFMPRFTLDFSRSLKKPLAQLGMGLAFQYPGADFLPLGSSLFYISEVFHKTHLEVDEEGTIAAAATDFGMEFGAAMPLPVETKTLVFDRPFAILLRDIMTGAIIFAGVVYDP